MNDQLTAIVPVRHDDEALAGLLTLLRQWRLPFVVVDGASAPSTADLVGGAGTYLPSTPSRGAQIALGIEAAATRWVWVLHADTRPTLEALNYVGELSRQGRACWGRFDVVLPGLEFVAAAMNWRSRCTKICTGDQAMFFDAELLGDIGGFPRQPLMEDIEVSKRLKRAHAARFEAPSSRVESSPRRWRGNGVARTIFSMWRFRLRYFYGAAAEDLAREYYA